MKRIFYLFLIIISVAVTYGCGDGDNGKKRLAKEEKDSLRRADSLALKIGVMPTEDCLPIVVAKELGLFDKAGTDVHLRRYRAMSECRKALVDSLVEGAVIDTTLMSELNGTTPWLYSGMRTQLSWQFLTAKKARIKRIDQLADKMIAADSHGESHRIAERAIDSLMRKKQHVFIIQVEDLETRCNMLVTGNVDAALLPEPHATKARKAGANVIGSVKSGPAGVVAFRKKSMADARRKQQQKAFAKAVEIANDSIKRYGKDKYIQLLQW